MASAFHVYFGPEALTAPIGVRKIGPRDCFAALREGLDDFVAMPTHAAFLGLFYALGGIALAALSSFGNALHLVFPFAAGFALIGPFFAVGLYELSRRRESGLPASLRDAFAVFRSPALPSIIALGLYLFVIFALWIGVAELLYVHLYGPNPPAAAVPFLDDVLTSSRGWLLIVLGGLVGLCFAAVALCISVISFPLMLDRDVGLVPAVVASMRLAREKIPDQSRCGVSSSRRRLLLARCRSSSVLPSSYRCSATPHGGSIAGRSGAIPPMRFRSGFRRSRSRGDTGLKAPVGFVGFV